MAMIMFPGQGSQYEGMGKELYDTNDSAKARFEQADDILGFGLSKIMFEGSAEDLQQTKVTQPAVFLNAIIRFQGAEQDLSINAVGGHSLGELTALVANGCLNFEDGLTLVSKRAIAMQEACNNNTGTMAAIIGLEDEIVENICEEIDGTVVAANYNCPGQLVISGEVPAVEKAAELAKEKGARRALILNVNGAFHSPLMSSAKDALEKAILESEFSKPQCPIYQNVTAKAENDPVVIKKNLIAQLTNPVRWTQSMQQMIQDGHSSYVECGAKVLSSFMRRVDRSLEMTQL